MKILTVVGNRPQFVKAAAVSNLLRQEHEETLVHTGQHYDRELSGLFFDQLSIPTPDYQLGVGSLSSGEQIAAVVAGCEPIIESLRPDLTLVYGDTNSTLAAAVAAKKAAVPLAHIEAGMRSFDRTMPEESNRVLTDHCSKFLLCPSAIAVENLRGEGIERGVYEVGDVMVDIALQVAERGDDSKLLPSLDLEPGNYLLLTAHRPGNVDRAEELAQLVELIESLPERCIFPLHPRTATRLDQYRLRDRLEKIPTLSLIDPIGYPQLLQLLRNAKATLTDSGGLQKEAYLFATKCITLRTNTEWVETVEYGWNTLVGLDRDAALAALEAELPSERPELYGGGQAALEVLKVLSQY